MQRKNKAEWKEDQRRKRGNVHTYGVRHSWNSAGFRIRRLTPLEAFRLQGVPDAYFERAASVCSDAQLYRQIGNAVTVPVVQAIGEKLAEYWKGENEYDSSYFLQQTSL